MTIRYMAIWLGFIGFVIAILIVPDILKAQPAENNTRQWQIKTAEGYVQVIDTTGACLYIFQDSYSSAGVSITALSKATLPFKAGCQ